MRETIWEVIRCCTSS